MKNRIRLGRVMVYKRLKAGEVFIFVDKEVGPIRMIRTYGGCRYLKGKEPYKELTPYPLRRVRQVILG